ncbi:MAG: NAD(P)/FAD-dependent oxidoreductase, partial [Acidimicrobiia bacterium]
MYDAIVIGARVAGSPTAMLLARQGHRVLLVDRASFPSDTVSTHFLHPGGSSYLNRWGLLDKVLETTPSWTRFTLTREGISATGAPPLEAVQRRLGALHGDDGSYAVARWCGPRRTVLDGLLVDAAAESGAEVRQGTTIDELVWDGERVVGVKGRSPTGAAFTETARIVIGADGRHSPTARAVGVEPYNERPR